MLQFMGSQRIRHDRAIELSLTELKLWLGFPGGSEVKASAWNAGDPGSIPGSGRSPGGGMATLSAIPAWRIPMGRGAW